MVQIVRHDLSLFNQVLTQLFLLFTHSPSSLHFPSGPDNIPTISLIHQCYSADIQGAALHPTSTVHVQMCWPAVFAERHSAEARSGVFGARPFLELASLLSQPSSSSWNFRSLLQYVCLESATCRGMRPFWDLERKVPVE